MRQVLGIIYPSITKKKMKTIFKFSLLAIVLLFISCDENDDVVNDVQNPDGFTYNQNFYETVNAYINVDDDDDNADGIPDSYTFFFTDGRMFDNDANVYGSSGDYLFSVSTSKLVFLHVLTSENSSLSANPPSAGQTYVVSSNNSVILHDGQVDALTPPFYDNGFEFGMGNENVGTFHNPGVTGPTITVNQLDIDTMVPENSFIDVQYVFLNQNGETITGHYAGSLGIILD